jgi:hypothetical protein
MGDAPDQTEVKLREEMEETRTALSDKIETLEEKVVGVADTATTAVADTVQTVKAVVENTVESVKVGVEGTVETVKGIFDIRGHVERYPWAMFAGSVAAGFLAGKLIPSWPRGESSDGAARPDYAAAYTPPPTAREHKHKEGGTSWLGWLGEQFGPELEKVKGMALGAAFGLVRDMLARSVPQSLGSQVKEVVDSFTTKLGGKPVSGPMLPESAEEKREPVASAQL